MEIRRLFDAHAVAQEAAAIIAAEAKAAEDAGLTWVGDTTGASQAAGKVLVVVADRRKGDPSGRTINQMMKLAPR